MDMGDHRHLRRAPGVDVEAAARAGESLRGDGQERVGQRATPGAGPRDGGLDRAAGGGGVRSAQASRRAEVMGRRAARTAGSKPPITPITTAKAMATPTMGGVMRKAKAISLKLWVCPVPVE